LPATTQDFVKHQRALILFFAALLAAGTATWAGPTPRRFARMFDGQCFVHKLFVLAPPYATPPVPVAAIAQPCANAIAFDPDGVMAVTAGAVFGKLSIRLYRPPYSSASLPVVAFTPRGLIHPRGATWDTSGNLWVSDDEANRIFEFRPPFTNATQAAATLTVATQPIGVTVDRATKRMFVTDVGGNHTCAKTACHVLILRPPYRGKPIVTWTFAHAQPYVAALDASGRLFVEIDRSATEADINVYDPPFTNEENPTLVLRAGGPVRTLAFDPKGNLFGQLLESGGLIEFAAPIAGNRSAPTASFGCPKGVTCKSHGWAGLAFGP
jgi:hypothetical protein